MNQSIRLCRGEELRPPSVTKSLQCRYASRGVPYGPRKIEVVSEEPHIAVMHDFIMVSNEFFFLTIGWEPGGLEEGPLGSGPRVGADRIGYQEFSNTPGFVWPFAKYNILGLGDQ